ncbi:MAG: hypothetical protein FWH29_09835 [Methanobrevibacter sp.]|nr:hypothetical protein [Methanobrevibacter sp.]
MIEISQIRDDYKKNKPKMSFEEYREKRENMDLLHSEEVQKFSATTPKGYKIRGYISKQANEYMGTLAIYELDGEDFFQVIRGMPKIHYTEPDLKQLTNIEFREKVDGSNIGFCTLEKDGELIDIILKTRMLPQLNHKLTKILKENHNQELENIKQYLYENKGSLFFELYGYKNSPHFHHIKHDFQSKLSLLCGFDKNNIFLDNPELNKISKIFGFKRPDALFQKKNDVLIATDKFYDKFPYKTELNFIEEINSVYEEASSLYTNSKILAKLLEEINQNNPKNRDLIEGIMISGTDEDGKYIMKKCKPPSIEELHRFQGGGIVYSAKKELAKVLDEYENSTYLKIDYKMDKNIVLNKVLKYMEEDWSEKVLSNNETIAKITEVLDKEILSKEPTRNVKQIAEEIFNPNKEIKDLMKDFAEKYPHLRKKMSKKIYPELLYLQKKNS